MIIDYILHNVCAPQSQVMFNTQYIHIQIKSKHNKSYKIS